MESNRMNIMDTFQRESNDDRDEEEEAEKIAKSSPKIVWSAYI